jgi:hypothetical protein
MMKYADKLAVALAVLGALALLWWVLIGRPARDARAIVTSRAAGVVADKRGQAAADTTRIIERHFTETNRIERIHDAAQANIRSAQSPADLHRAGVAAVCLLSPAGGAHDPACPVQPDGARQPEG